jgi:hypothetical protein
MLWGREWARNGLIAFGQIVLRRIDGHEELPPFLANQ